MFLGLEWYWWLVILAALAVCIPFKCPKDIDGHFERAWRQGVTVRRGYFFRTHAGVFSEDRRPV